MSKVPLNDAAKPVAVLLVPGAVQAQVAADLLVALRRGGDPAGKGGGGAGGQGGHGRGGGDGARDVAAHRHPPSRGGPNYPPAARAVKRGRRSPPAGRP